MTHSSRPPSLLSTVSLHYNCLFLLHKSICTHTHMDTGMPNQRKSFLLAVQLLPAIGRLLQHCADNPCEAQPLRKAARQLLTVGLFAETHVAALRTLCTSEWGRVEGDCADVLVPAGREEGTRGQEAQGTGDKAVPPDRHADGAGKVGADGEEGSPAAKAPVSYQWQLLEVCCMSD